MLHSDLDIDGQADLTMICIDIDFGRVLQLLAPKRVSGTEETLTPVVVSAEVSSAWEES